MKSVFPFVTLSGDELYRVVLSLWIFGPSRTTDALSMRGLAALPGGCLETANCKCVFSLVLRSGQGRPAIRWVLNYALTFRTATAAATTATMIMAKPITLALSPVLGMDTVWSRMMGVLLAFQVMESLWL